MKGILQKLLQKRGIETVLELSPEEQATYETWERILSKEELTLEDIKAFCRGQIDVVEGKWRDLNLEQARKAELIPYHTVYTTLLMAIESPKAAREQLEKHLLELTK